MIPQDPGYAQSLGFASRDVGTARIQAASHPGDGARFAQLGFAWAERARLNGSFDDLARADQAFRAALRISPESPGARYGAATFAASVGRLDDAEALLEGLDGQTVAQPAEIQSRILRMRGDIAVGRGEIDRAESRYAQAASQADDAILVLRRTWLLSRTGNPDGARALLDRVSASRPVLSPEVRAEIVIQHAVLDLEQGRYIEALTRLEAAATLFPGAWRIDGRRAETLALLGRTREAEALYQNLIKRTGNPEFIDALAALLAGTGDRAGARRWSGQARGLWLKRIGQFPALAFGPALNHYLAGGDARLALRIARANVAAHPSGEAREGLVKALLKAGRAGEAMRETETVLATRWRSPETRALAAAACKAARRRECAASHRAAALAFNPNVFIQYRIDDPGP